MIGDGNRPDLQMNRTSAVFIAAILGTVMCAWPLPVRAVELPAAAFAQPPEHAAVDISPNGRFAAAKLLINGQYMLVIYDLDNAGKVKPVVASPRDMAVRWLRWKTDRRLLVSLEFASRRYGTATVETRLMAMDPDGGNLKLMVPVPKGKDPVQIADKVVSWLPDDPDHILMAFNPDDPSLPRVYRVNVHTAQRTLVEAGEKDIFWWTADQQGNLRIGEGANNSKLLETRFFRSPPSRTWDLVEEKPAGSGPVFHPVIFDRHDPDLLYLLSDHDGDTIGLYSYRLSSRSFKDLMFRHPEVDVSGITLDPSGTEIQGVSFVDDEAGMHWFDRRQADILDEVRSRIAARHVYMAGISADYRRAIIYAESPDRPGRYYLYEAPGKQLRIMAYAYPALEKAVMAPMRAISYKARDGLEIPGYLTLPADTGPKPAKPLPAIILPHGGPESRDFSSFDPMVQLFANRGYAVLQMNFRGSSGYGTRFRQAGARQWGRAMQDDVTDGTRWLIEQGIADPARICIVGWSYGGYAALMGAAREPALYRCSASIAGVSDLPRLIDSQRQYLFGRLTTQLIGDSWKDRKLLEENSPVNRIGDIRVPVFLAHGTSDRVVPPAQSAVMAKALARAKKPHEYLELEDADHSVQRSQERVSLFSALDEFLAKSLSSAAQ
jgi:dipeptidyl aminopeptidase/acylaminoacyl peptidase